ncbi:MAG TPA: AsmA-like C-terminal region-containing protein [Flavobacteriales bacterium]|nr:AsmA-like C-terminal region-containing protein [Flavobacteriales bacterium]HRJ37451.1 AsmA-like C-terminal region-containing protein [Flavobacteriales bacterium]
MFGKKNTDPSASKTKKPLWRRILKWTGISFLLLFIFALAAPFLFKDKIFALIKEQINNNLHGKFECEDYSLTLISSFPNFTMELKEVSLTGVDDFEGVKLLDAENIVLTIDLYSVIFGSEIDIREVGIKNTDVNVMVLDNGKANYDIAKSDSTKVAEGVDTSETKFALKVRNYYLENFNLVYDDKPGGMYARIVNLNHNGIGDFTQDLFDFKTTTTADTIDFYMSGIPYMKNTKLDSKLDFSMDMKNSKYTFMPEDYIKLNELDLGFDGFLAMTDVDMDMDINFIARKTDFKNIYSLVPAIYTADYNSIKFGGKTEIKGSMKGKMSEQSMPAMNIDLLVENGSFQYPGLPKSASAIFVKANVNSKGDPTMDDMVIDMPVFKMDLGGNKLDAFFNLRNPMTDPGIKAGLKANFNLSTLREVVPVSNATVMSGFIDSDVAIDGRMSMIDKGEYEKFKAEGSIVAKEIVYNDPEMGYPTNLKIMDFRFAPTHLELAAFDATVDKTQLMAKGKIDNYLAYALKGDVLKGVFSLNSPEIDLTPFMSSGTETAATPAATPEASAPAADSYVLEIPRNIDFEMNSSIGKIRYPNDPGAPEIVLDNVNGKITLREGVMSLNQLKLNTLGASVLMSGDYDSRNLAAPSAAFFFDINNMDIKTASETFPMIAKMAPMASKCTGKFSTKLDFNTKLNTKMEPIYETMNGKGTLATKSIYIEGFEPLNRIAEKLKIDRLKKQTINDVSVSYQFREGRVWVDPYDVTINKYKTTIGGSTGFDGTIDYKADMAIPRSEFGSGANDVLNGLMAKANAKAGTTVELGDMVNVRILITGTVADPKVETDLKQQGQDLKNEIKEQIKEAVKEKVEEKVQEVKEDVKEKASAEAEKIMKDAEAKAAQIRAEAKKAADKTREEGKNAGDKLIAEAGSNPLKKAAAEKSAQKLQKEADEKASKLEKEADEKAQKVLDEGRAQADKLK